MVIILAIILIPGICIASAVPVQGHVRDQDTGRPMKGIVVEIYDTNNPAKPVANSTTDESGYYKFDVEPNRNYDIYVRLGKVNPSKTIYVGTGGAIQDFRLSTKGNWVEITEESGLWVVVVVAIFIILFIIFDQLYLKKRRMLKALEKETSELEKKLDKDVVEGETNELDSLKKERDRLKYMINRTKIKYHKREIDEESFREIVRDYQKKLIEVETKIEEIEKE